MKNSWEISSHSYLKTVLWSGFPRSARFIRHSLLIVSCVFGWLSLTPRVQAQEKPMLSGYLKDAHTGTYLVGATIQVQGQTVGVTTNEQGFFSLMLPKGEYTVLISYLGYLTQKKQVSLQANQQIAVSLSMDQVQMSEVVISDTRPDQHVRSTDMGIHKIGAKTLKAMPPLMGEVDIVRNIQLLPGVSTAGEGATGFNVRGGSIDQNLILMDDAPVYNSSHLMGMFSIFNADVVKDVTLVKAGIPAQYGGRLSSLLDVRIKEGNKEKLTLAGGLGTVSSRLMIEAPIVKNKASVVVAGRRTYADLIARADKTSDYFYFGDLNAKLNASLGAKDQLFISTYYGRDGIAFGKGNERMLLSWGNQTGTLRWDHLFSKRLSGSVSGIFSHYNYNVGIPKGSQAYEWRSHLYNYSGKTDFLYQLNENQRFTFGGSVIRYSVSPANVRSKSDISIIRSFDLPEQEAMEYAAYVGSETTIGARLGLQYGLRFSAYNFLGPQTVYAYIGEPNLPKTATDPHTYEKGESIAYYPNLEPRASVRYSLGERSSVKASYNRTVQYVHLLSNTTASSLLDVWSPSTRNIKPQKADQVSLGYFRNLSDNTFEASAEVYYKALANQIDYRDGAKTLLNENVESDLLYGAGRAYGVEFSVRKNAGDWTGWLNYTLSRSERKIAGISNNEWYPATYDRTHVLSAVALYTLNKRWSFAGNFTYSTGVATTFPDTRYQADGGTLMVPYNSDHTRNGYRIPAYHRLDLSATLQQRKNNRRRWQGEWVFSVYNAYSHKNAYSVFFRQNKDNPFQTEAVRQTVFGFIQPGVTYNFKF
jgi:hypothetical protein